MQRITGRSGLLTGLRNQQLVIASVEQALRNGADAVVPTFFIGPESETYCCRSSAPWPMSAAWAPADGRGIPAGGPDAVPYHGPYSVDDLRMAVRVPGGGRRRHQDLVPRADPESFRRVLDYSLVPVVAAGWPRADTERDVLEMVRGAMDAGAAGVAMGRKIWQSRDPVGLVRAVSAIIRQGAGSGWSAMSLLTASGL